MKYSRITKDQNGILGLALMLFLIIFFSSGLGAAEPLMQAFNCWYDDSYTYVYIRYSVTGGEEITYPVTGVAAGAIKLKSDPPDLQGPTQEKYVEIECIKQGSGKVQLKFWKGTVMLHSCTLCFDCTGSGAKPKEKDCEVHAFATLSELFLIVLALSVGGFFVWQLKRRRKAGVSLR